MKSSGEIIELIKAKVEHYENVSRGEWELYQEEKDRRLRRFLKEQSFKHSEISILLEHLLEDILNEDSPN